jgi:hypothetical protein
LRRYVPVHDTLETKSAPDLPSHDDKKVVKTGMNMVLTAPRLMSGMS